MLELTENRVVEIWLNLFLESYLVLFSLCYSMIFGYKECDFNSFYSLLCVFRVRYVCQWFWEIFDVCFSSLPFFSPSFCDVVFANQSHLLWYDGWCVFPFTLIYLTNIYCLKMISHYIKYILLLVSIFFYFITFHFWCFLPFDSV